MKQRPGPLKALAGLLSAVLLAGCTTQSELKSDEQPVPSTSAIDRGTAVADPVSGTYTGTRTIELGAPPAEATHIYLELTCRSAGTILVQDGDEVTCTDPDDGTTRVLSSFPVSPGQDSVQVIANDPGVGYELKAVYENGASIQ
ncbi:hypothetical protein ACX80W_04585 [Arthrobacter sp. TMN-37]